MLRTVEDMRKNRKRKEQARLAFNKDPFTFVKLLFDKEKCGSFLVPKEKPKGYLEKVHKDQGRF